MRQPSLARGNEFSLASHVLNGIALTTESPETINKHDRAISQEQYRVIAFDGDHLLIRTVQSGQILTIVKPQPETSLNERDLPPGMLVILAHHRANKTSSMAVICHRFVRLNSKNTM